VSERKTRGPAVGYVAYFSAMARVAESCGYALALHGSLNRDLDLIAVPWTAHCLDADDLVAALVRHVDGLLHVPETDGGQWSPRPHGRRAVVLLLTGGGYVDLSVMPRQEPVP
jgi:hypothetical protein